MERRAEGEKKKYPEKVYRRWGGGVHEAKMTLSDKIPLKSAKDRQGTENSMQC